MSQDKEQQFIQNVKAGLDRSLQELDAVTRSRIKAARRTALEHAQSRPAWLGRKPLILATAMSAVLAVSVWLLQKPGNGNSLPLDDLPLLSASEDFELYRDLEFYQWLEYETEQG